MKPLSRSRKKEWALLVSKAKPKRTNKQASRSVIVINIIIIITLHIIIIQATGKGFKVLEKEEKLSTEARREVTSLLFLRHGRV
jgi:hypothetical protein